LLLLTGVAAMTHLSGMCVVAAALLCLGLFRARVDWRRAGAAVVVLVILAAPYAYYLVTEGSRERAMTGRFVSGEGTAAEYRSSLSHVIATCLDVVTDHGFERVLGQPERDPKPKYGSERPGSVVARAAAALAVLGLLIVAGSGVVKRRTHHQRGLIPCSARDAIVLLIWLIVPLLAYGLTGIHVYTHYFIVVMPVLFLAVAMLLETVRRAGVGLRAAWASNLVQALPIALGLGIACSGALSWWTVLRCIGANGGAPGGYGVALIHKMDAIDSIVTAAGGRPIRLVGDTQDRTPQPGSEDYQYLLRRALLKGENRATGLTGPTSDFVVLDLYRYNLAPAERRAAEAFQPKQFGPILILSLPEARSRDTAGPPSP
jgi:hypothetical protein